MTPRAHSKIGLLAVDLDDTLLGEQGTVSPGNVRALQELHAAGVEVCVLSGRMPRAMRRCLGDLPFVRYIASYHGALVMSHPEGQVLATELLPVDTVEHLCDWASARGYSRITFVGDDAWATSRDEVVDFYEHRAGVTVNVVSAGDVPSAPAAKVIVYEPYRDGYQGRGETASERRLFAEAELLKLETARHFRTGLGYIEFTHARATKGAALHNLASVLGLQLGATAAVGDSYNDLDMLEAAALSFAVANAAPAVREVVDRVVAANVRDGVAEAAHDILTFNHGS